MNGMGIDLKYVFIPMEIANFSNSMGCITDMRLKLKYQIKGLIWYSEYLSADYELISKEDKKFDFRKRKFITVYCKK